MADSSLYIGSVYFGTIYVYDRSVTPHVLADPGTLSVTITPKVAAPSTYTYAGATIARVSTGKYTFRHPCGEKGAHVGKALSTGNYAAGLPFIFTVQPDL